MGRMVFICSTMGNYHVCRPVFCHGQFDKVEDTSNVSNQEIKHQLDALGKISILEWRLIVISISLLTLWATEGILHPFDSTTVTILAVAIMLLPKYGIYTWSDVQK